MHYLLSMILHFHKLQVNVSVPYSWVSSVVEGHYWFPDKAGGGGYGERVVKQCEKSFSKRQIKLTQVLQYVK